MFAAEIAKNAGISRAMAFDMGGTTAKISLIENARPELSKRFEIARVYRDMKGSGLPVRIPVIEMVEIGAGGGSIARVDAMSRIRVGPDSAGSDPGPVAYARGGNNTTVTDANLLLGKLNAHNFAGGSITLDKPAAERTAAQEIGLPLELDAIWAAAGITEIVEENMANAARVHTVERGKEPSEYTLIAFGGGAPLHAAQLARKLGINRIVVPASAGVGSAVGFLCSPVSYQITRSHSFNLQQPSFNSINAVLSSMEKEASEVVQKGLLRQASGSAATQENGNNTLEVSRQADLRYCGQGHELTIDLPAGELALDHLQALRRSFETRYEKNLWSDHA